VLGYIVKGAPGGEVFVYGFTLSLIFYNPRAIYVPFCAIFGVN